MTDTLKKKRVPSSFNREFSQKGQHTERGIAEMNLFILLSALGRSQCEARISPA
jgi:pyruvate dehydrogenase E1 component